MSLSSTLYPASLTLDALYGLEVQLGFDTIDGYRVSQQEGEAALRNGVAVLVGGLLVGFEEACARPWRATATRMRASHHLAAAPL